MTPPPDFQLSLPPEPGETYAIVHAYPTGHVEPRLLEWLQRGPPAADWDSVAVMNVKGIDVSYNRGVRRALATGRRHLVFADHDVIPTAATDRHAGTDEFWGSCQADVVCCPCRLDIEGVWGDPAAWHAALWRTTADVLAAIPPPWFAETLTDDGTARDGCLCSYFARKARAAGFVVARQGWADHPVKSRGPRP